MLGIETLRAALGVDEHGALLGVPPTDDARAAPVVPRQVEPPALAVGPLGLGDPPPSRAEHSPEGVLPVGHCRRYGRGRLGPSGLAMETIGACAFHFHPASVNLNTIGHQPTYASQ